MSNNLNIDFSKKVALQFNGGRDSLVCLYLLKPHWENITVIWLNSGDAFPEAIKQMETISQLVPNFIEVKGLRPLIKEQYGYPVDLISAHSLAVADGVLTPPKPTIKTLPYHMCCIKSLWTTMYEACKTYDYIIRGQRNAESMKSVLRNGAEVLGQKYIFPIEDWSDEEVNEYIKDNDIQLQPQYYLYDKATSLDCMGCTAFDAENKSTLKYMKKFHQAEYKKVQFIRSEIKKELQSQLDLMEI